MRNKRGYRRWVFCRRGQLTLSERTWVIVCSVDGELQQSKSNHHRAILYVTGDALRVVDEISKVCCFSTFLLVYCSFVVARFWTDTAEFWCRGRLFWCRGRPNFGNGFGYGAKTASKMTFDPVSVLAIVISAKFPLLPKVERAFGVLPYFNSSTVWAITEVAQAL